MSDSASLHSPEIHRAFAENDRQVKLNNLKVGCLLGVVLMPAGMVLDYFIYPEQLVYFLKLRFLCSALIVLFYATAVVNLGHRFYREFGIILAMFPTFFISWMIYKTEGHLSPYYAGLNLVLLVIGFVCYWTAWESSIAFGLVAAMYVTACLLHGPIKQFGTFINNIYFLGVTGVIVVTGSYVHTRMRFREFALRYELDINRRKLEENNQKLIALNRVKDQFFANVSHELRTPLTLLLAPLESLLNEKRHLLDSQSLDWVNIMQANGMRLLKLINDLLDLVKLESGRLTVKLEPLDMKEFVGGLCSSVRKVAQDKGVRLDTYVEEEVGRVRADRDKLEKVILNLLFNSVKFTGAGGRVDIAIERENDELVIQVTDTGMGISKENLPFIFDRFWQADGSANRKYQGTGLGLALVKELIEAQGGSVSASSELGKGTVMTVKLPYLKAPEAGPSKEEKAEVAPRGEVALASDAAKTNEWLSNLYRRAELFPSMTPLHESLRPEEISGNGHLLNVLIADDEPDMLRFLKSQLGSHYHILEAVDGQQAVDKASQFLPDIILLDMMMPEKDGLQACRDLRERTPTRNIPIVLLTARADERTKLSVLAAGANDFLTKPFSTTELHVRIKNLVASHQLQRQLARQNQILEATIEQLKETETQLVQSEKLASLGRMSAGIIHEINNPLNYAKTGIYMLKNMGGQLMEEEKNDFEDIIKDVEEGINRVRTIVSDLRGFTHPNASQFDVVDLNKAVTAALRFVSHDWRDKVEIHQNISEDQTIWGNSNKLIQVLVNLLQNALDAMKEKNFADEKPAIWIETRCDAAKTRLIIRDNGPGIAPEIQGKIFDPFFTTKDVGKGMGLGLSICYRIIEEHEGRILLKSELGKFCEFTLEFPAKMTQSAETQAA